MDRRHFIRAGVFTAGGTAALPLIAEAAAGQAAGTSPYGSLDGIAADENGVILPPGFTSRIVAVAGEPVGDTDWRNGATGPRRDGHLRSRGRRGGSRPRTRL